MAHLEHSAADAAGLRASVSQPRLIMIVVGAILGMLLGAVDQTVVGTAMPRVIAQLGGLNHYAWVFTGYLLASTVSIPIYGKLSDIYGRRPFFLVGMVLFLVGSALSGLSQDMTQLIVFRALQGLGGGAMLPIAQAIIGDVFSPAERGKWQGLLMAVFGLATIVGPILGGWITDTWGWRWVFYVNMPVGLLALLTAGLAIPAQGGRRRHQIDVLGAAALVAGTVPLLLAFSWAGTQYAWGSPRIIGLIVVAVVMIAVFVGVETRAAEPIISPHLFGNRIFTVSVVATFLATMGMYGAIMYLPLFVQGVLGETATSAGEVLTPMMLGFMISSAIGGQIMSRTGRYKVLAILGFFVGTIGMALLARMDVNATNGVVIRDMIITGLGIGIGASLFTIVVQNAFPFRLLGQVTASLQFFRSIGGTIGVAIFGTVMTNQFQSGLQANLPGTVTRAVPPGQLAQLANPQVLLAPGATDQIQHAFAAFGPRGPALFQQLMTAIRVSLAGAITESFALGAALMALGLVATFFLREVPLRKGHYLPTEAPTDLAEAGVELVPNTRPEAVREMAGIENAPGAADRSA